MGTVAVNLAPVSIECTTLTTAVICCLLTIPCAVDGYKSYFAGGTTNGKRFVTGLLAGGALTVLVGCLF